MGHLLQSAIRLRSDYELPGFPRIHRQIGIRSISVDGRLRLNWQAVPVQCRISAGAAEIKVASTTIGPQEEKLKILMAAGGTGGHVYPAIAIADEIRRLCDTAEVEFVGTKDRMEWSAVPRAGYKVRPIPAVAIRRPVTSFENLWVPMKLVVALFSSWKLLSDVRPNVVVGTGGYVSGPLCLVAAMMRCPVVVQEQNAYAGLTNRLLGRVAEVVFIAFSAAIVHFPKHKSVLYGNPTRAELRQYMSAAVARRFFFPQDQPRVAKAESKDDDQFESTQHATTRVKPRKQVVLILGGSLGAQVVNKAVADMAVAMLDEYPTRYIVWQTGPRHYEDIRARVGTHPRLAIFPYVNAMHMAYAAADLVVARAGAITCSEMLVTGKPSILVPSVNVAEDHQTKNAMAMGQTGSAKVLPEISLDSSSLTTLINELLGDPEKLMEMSERGLKAATPDASSRIAEHVLHLARTHVSRAVA